MSTPPIGLQLYSVREAMAADADGALARVSALGFEGVELAGTAGLSPEEFRSRLDHHGLQLISAMVGLADEGLSADTLEWSARVGTPRLVVNLWPHDFADRDAIERAAHRFNLGCAAAGEVGIALGYHNHFWEFLPSAAGPCPMSEFARLVGGGFFELDLYWLYTACAGAWREPLAAISDRVRTVHVKDGPGTYPAPGEQAEPMTAAGTGVVEIDAILRAVPTAEWHVVEFDECATDIFEAVAESREFLVGRGHRSVGSES